MDNQPSRKGAEDGLGKPPPEYSIPATDVELLAQCRVDTFRAGGKGGQHQNKTDSAVRLVHKPSGLTVIARDHRSQFRNKETALGRLRAQLVSLAIPTRPRVSTKIPVKERRQRVENKKKRSKVKALRKKPPPPED